MTAEAWLNILRGLVRPVAALGGLLIAGLCALLGHPVPEWYVGLVTWIVRDFFASREKK